MNILSPKITFEGRQTELVKLIFIYRYLSLVITSIFFLFGDSSHLFINKVFIVTCITMSSIILNYLYYKTQKMPRQTLFLVFIETIGNSIILIPSGGLHSPYVWYALNTIIIASVELNKKYCWINLFIYLFNSTWVTHVILGRTGSFLEIVSRQSNLILSFLLITGIIQILSYNARKLERESIKLGQANNQLLVANTKIKNSMNHIMDLYQTVDFFTGQERKEDLVKFIVDYTEKITKSDIVIFAYQTSSGEEIEINSNVASREWITQRGFNIKKLWNGLSEIEIPRVIMIENRKFIFKTIEYNCHLVGVLGIEISLESLEESLKENIDQLKFISQLSSIVFEKFELIKVNERLLINKEQNRIANEIHDNVLQKLFYISCGVFEVMKKSKDNVTGDVQSDLNAIKNTINGVMKDLRSTIYDYSWNKNGKNSFIEDVHQYINEVKALYKISIGFVVRGCHTYLSTEEKKSLYRIICESISNAVRHGKATNIDIELDVDVVNAYLTIRDNGNGFQLKELRNSSKNGLGVKNIYTLVESMGGEVEYSSDVGIGTTICISVHNKKVLCREAVV